jgi:DNA-binding IclR family transcriptional regulator
MTTKPNPSNATRRYHIPSLDRAMRVLEWLARHPAGAGVSEVTAALELPKNSVFRILTTLHELGYLLRDEPAARYRLSGKLLALGYSGTGAVGVLDASQDVMASLRDELGETVLLGQLIGREGVVIDQVLASHPVKVSVEIGHRFPLHTAAPAKAILAFLPDDRREQILRDIRCVRHTERTITRKAALREALAEVRQRGWATDLGEEVESIHCLAAPIFNHAALPVAAVWVTGPAVRFSQNRFASVADSLCHAAATISNRLGHTGPLDISTVNHEDSQ